MILDFFNCIAILLAFFSFDGMGTKQIDGGALQEGRTQRVQRVVVGKKAVVLSTPRSFFSGLSILRSGFSCLSIQDRGFVSYQYQDRFLVAYQS